MEIPCQFPIRKADCLDNRFILRKNIRVAHIRESDGVVQSVEDHLHGVASLSACFAEKLGLAKCAELIGLLHDLGKYSEAFQNYIQLGELEETQGKVDHSTAGAQWIWNELRIQGPGPGPGGELIAQMLAVCVASHHGGLIDCIAPDGKGCFGKRMQKPVSEARAQADAAVLDRASRLFQDPLLIEEGLAVMKAVLRREKLGGEAGKERRVHFLWGLSLRMLFSCLIDADRTDTSDFENRRNLSGRMPVRFMEWDGLAQLLENHLKGLDGSSKIDSIRREVSRDCLKASERPKGLFTLTVPTGGGKTLASLRFALNHAARHGQGRIIYAVPFTTIIEQNADVVRQILEPGGQRSPTIVLEHHSNLAPEKETLRNKLLAENWDAPIVFTTMVQVLEALFGGGTRNVRRLHQMAGAVLIFDEIQTLPIKTVHMFCNATRLLHEQFGSTVLLCTATQPLLNEVDREKGHLPLSHANEVVTDVAGLFRELKRVEVQDRRKPGGWSVHEVAALARELTEESGSCLIIVNTKRAAREFFEAIGGGNESDAIFHLSTNMCPAHRLCVLKKIERKIGKGGKPPIDPGPTICVSTQLIEAGVDIDFGSVIRFVAGLDSIAQAAGRCNRNQRRERGTVAIVNPSDENLDRLDEIRAGRNAAVRVLGEFADSPESLGGELLSPTVISRYFQYYFFDRRKLMDYPVKEERDDTLLNMLAENNLAVGEYQRQTDSSPNHRLRQAFKSAGIAFDAIESTARGVVVPYKDEGKKIIADLCGLRPEILPALMRKAQRYSVNVFPNIIRELEASGSIYEAQRGTGIMCLVEQNYSENFGVATVLNNEGEFLNA